MSHIWKDVDRNTKPEWVLHLHGNGYPKEAPEYPFIPDICDEHTEGLCDIFCHPYEFQSIFGADVPLMSKALDELGFQVRAGREFKPGELVDGIFRMHPLRLDLHVDVYYRPVLRVVIPDQKGRWPENPKCNSYFQLQAAPLVLLRNCSFRSEE